MVQKAGAEPTAVLHALDAFIGRQPKVSGGNNRQVRQPLDALHTAFGSRFQAM